MNTTRKIWFSRKCFEYYYKVNNLALLRQGCRYSHSNTNPYLRMNPLSDVQANAFHHRYLIWVIRFRHHSVDGSERIICVYGSKRKKGEAKIELFKTHISRNEPDELKIWNTASESELVKREIFEKCRVNSNLDTFRKRYRYCWVRRKYYSGTYFSEQLKYYTVWGVLSSISVHTE